MNLRFTLAALAIAIAIGISAAAPVQASAAFGCVDTVGPLVLEKPKFGQSGGFYTGCIQRTFDLIKEVDRLGFRVPKDYLPVYDSTMARFWVENERAEAQLRRLLYDLPCGRLLSDQELEDLGVAFDDDRYGHLVFVMEPGTLICPSDMGRFRFSGMHGFHPKEDPSAYAVFLSSEQHAQAVNHITEVFPTILKDLNLS